MRKMTATFFKTHCLSILREVQTRGETVLITKHGTPVAKVIPMDAGVGDIYNFMAGKGSITGDILSPALGREDLGEFP